MEGDQGVDVDKGVEGNMKKRLLAVLTVFGMAVTLCACGNTGGNGDSQKASSSNAAEPAQTVAEQSGDEIADLLGKKLIPDEERDYYQKYFTEQYDKVRKDNISDWKDSDGNWCYPKDYEIQWIPSDDEVMAAQQFPQEMLDAMSTDELYRFIRKAPGSWSQLAFDSYAQAISYYYCRYNFIAELMRREDCAEVIHTYYEKTPADDVKQYSKTNSVQSTDRKKFAKREQFQLLEGLEWFFLYKDGKAVPDEEAFGMSLISQD